MTNFAPKSLERAFEKSHVNQIISGQNEVERIFRLSIDDISKEIKRLQKLRKASPTQYGKQLIRNKSLKKQLITMRDNLNKNLNSQIKGEISEAWNMANIKNDQLVNGFTKGINIRVPAKYYNINTKALENFIKRKTKGLSLSQKVWNLSNDTHKLVEDWIATGITQGKSTAKISRDIWRMIGDPKGSKVINDAGETIRFSKVSDFVRNPAPKGHYKNPRASIKRLVRSEINMSYRNSDHDRYQQIDFVVGKRVHLSNGHGDWDICDNLIGDYPKTFIFDGFHSNCLCFVTSILMTKEEFKSGIFPNKSVNVIKKVPNPTQRYVKTRGEKNKGSSWYDKNFKNNIPLKKVGGASKGITKYENIREWDYEASPDRYLTKSKKNLVTK